MVLVDHCGDMFAAWLGCRLPWWVSAASFYGVELFFVLSGFLIGRLLMEIMDEGPTARAWLVFMTRRWMRTLPLYFLWLSFLAAFWQPHFWEPDHRRLLWHVLPPFLTLTQNLAWPMTYDWFGVSWSLTVEEWFYLGFSTLLLAAALVLGRRTAFWTVLLAFLAVPLALRWQVPAHVDFNREISGIAVMRLDAIAFGVAMAWLLPRAALLSRWRSPACAIGLLLVGGVWSGLLERHLGLGTRAWRAMMFDLASLGFALCLPAAAALRRLPGVTAKPVRAVSEQSYAIYLMHLSLMEFAGHYIIGRHLSPWIGITLSLAAIWGLSWASWRWIETPILRRRPAQHAKRAELDLGFQGEWPDEALLAAANPSGASREALG